MDETTQNSADMNESSLLLLTYVFYCILQDTIRWVFNCSNFFICIRYSVSETYICSGLKTQLKTQLFQKYDQ